MYDLSARNPFIDVKLKKLHFPKDNSGSDLKKLYQQAAFYKKEYDLDTTLEISLFLKWKEPNKDNFYLSPLLFKPAKIKLKRKIEQEFIVAIEEDIPFQINPILSYSFSRFYDLNLPETTDDIPAFIERLKSELNSKNHQLTVTDEFNEEPDWQIIELTCLGNFNYKKSLLGKDYDQIIRQPTKQIVDLISGINEKTTQDNKSITPIIDLDFTQYQAVQQADKGNLVIQGPPGTGKSHTIVGMIGNFVAQGKKVLFVSQKRSALEVVYDRLKDFGLKHLTGFLNTEKDEKKEFFGDLKDSWEFLSQKDYKELTPVKINNKLLKFYLNEYQSFNEKLGASYHNVLVNLYQSGYDPADLEYSGNLPTLADWRKSEDFLLKLENKLSSKYEIDQLSEATFTKLNKAVFKEPDPITILDKRLDEIESVLSAIQQVAEKYQLGKNHREIFDYALAASILNMVNQTQLNLLDKESKSFKSFGNWAKKYELLKAKIYRAEQANKAWKNKPSKSEITELIDLLKHHHAPKGILGILKRRNEKLDKAFAGFSPNLSNIARQQLLEELRTEWNLKAELDEIIIKLKHNFNINDPDSEIKHILQLRNKLSEISGAAYLNILEHEDSNDLIQTLSELHPKIQHFNNIARFLLHDEIPENTDETVQLIKNIKSELHQFKLLLPELQHYFMLPFDIRDLIQKNNFSIHQLSAIISYHKLIEQTRFERAFDDLNGPNLQNEIEQLIKSYKSLHKFNRSRIVSAQQKAIQEKDNLTSTPASKLTEEQKNTKKEYRNIKKLLVHEISKKQRHIPIKTFTETTWEFLADIYPIWIMNPLSVSERLNCSKEIFDVVIFDESSQIPLEDALPAIYRSKQIVVVGDDQQMPPSSFFSSHSDGPTLLDKADVSYPKLMLKWHYRSNHPQLIQFSNIQFYDNELLTVPPVDIQSPIEFRKVAGVFANSVNVEEAQQIASFLAEEALVPDEIGIIAFSAEQEKLIRKTLQDKNLLNEDLLIRNLENVQGIERDHIIISVGYAPNSEGNFAMNFGPVNQQSGSNRLNVLFTRAKKKITLFASVTADDFKLSENPGVNCLRDYLHYAENLKQEKTSSNEVYFKARKGVVHYSHFNGSAINCFVQHTTARVLLIDPCTKESESKDLYTVYTVLKSRFKEVKVLLSKDMWQNKDGFKHLVNDYFSE